MKFSIRDLLLVTALVAIAVAWWVDNRQKSLTIQQLTEEVQRRHFYLTFSDQLNSPPMHSTTAPNSPQKTAP